MPIARVTFLLPAAARFGQQRLGSEFAKAFGLARHASVQIAGRRAQLLRHFDLPEGAWPIAALSRNADVGDADGAAWLRADPAYLRPDINGVRLMACGEALALTPADCDALLPALRPLFGDAGFFLDAPSPSRWYLRLPREARVPVFADPGEALGDDLFEHLDSSPEGRRWRALISEVQVVLHNHSWNAKRAARGLLPVNSLWLWGGGGLPVRGERQAAAGRDRCVHSDDDSACALATALCIAKPLPEALPAKIDGDVLFDLTAARDLAWLQQAWLLPALSVLRRGRIASLDLDREDGHVSRLGRWQRLRFWRRPRPRFDA